MPGMEIAVIGMAGIFPAAKDIAEFWNNLEKGMESISFFSDAELSEAGIAAESLNDPKYVKALAILEEKNYFDAPFFGYNRREVELMDPQVRVFHEYAWKALEDAGYTANTSNAPIGLYAGAANSFYWESLSYMAGMREQFGEFEASILASKDFMTTRISYVLDLKGPSLAVQTACSTSLVAIHLACRALLTGECKMALAGGVSIHPFDRQGYRYQEGMVISPDGHCRAFDTHAGGTIPSEGAGIVALKRLEEAVNDRDHIYAIIKGSAINNDGKRKVGFTAPSVEGQADVIRRAQRMAKVEPESIGYIETHGTGTVLGDPIEIEALKKVFAAVTKGSCGLGSVKTNIGHLDAAAGAAGFIKTVLALNHRLIPPSLHFETANPALELEDSPFYVNKKIKEWKNEDFPLRAGVSSFGIGGTNAHIILEEWPNNSHIPANAAEQQTGRAYKLILLSAKSRPSLDMMMENLARYFKNDPGVDLADAAYTLQQGREEFRCRSMIVAQHPNDVVDRFSKTNIAKIKSHYLEEEHKKRVVFMFPGQGAQYVDMGLALYRSEPIFRDEIDRCAALLAPVLDFDLRAVIYPPPGEKKREESIDDTSIVQTVIFVFEYALANLIMKWGIKPGYMIGYSYGEYTAACLAGVISLEDAVKLAALRGRLTAQLSPGVMLSIPLPEQEISPLLNEDLSLAVDNGPSCIVAGPMEAIAIFEKLMNEKGVLCMRVKIKHAAHSKMMEPILQEFEKSILQIKFQKPQIPYISCSSGNWISAEESVNPAYWVDHLRSTVRFAKGVDTLLREKNLLFVEVGPGKALCNLVRQEIDDETKRFVLNLVRNKDEDVDDVYYLLERVGRLWLYGLKIDWRQFYGEEKRKRIPLPTYPFEKIVYPIGRDLSVFISKPHTNLLSTKAPALQRNLDIADWFYAPQWKSSMLLPGAVEAQDKIVNLVFCDENGLGAALAGKFKPVSRATISVNTGAAFKKQSETAYMINPASLADYERLFIELNKKDRLPDRIVYAWSAAISDGGAETVTAEEVRKQQDTGCFGLFNLIKIMQQRKCLAGKKIVVITNDLNLITGMENIHPGRATILGLLKVVSQEHPTVFSSSIDVLFSEGIDDARITKLYEEIVNNTRDRTVVLRNNRRWLQVYDRIKTANKKKENEKEKEIPLNKSIEGGVYLITGGLGNVGYFFANYLIKKVDAKIILTGRTELPQPKDWNDFLSKPGLEKGIEDKILRLKDLQAGAREVVYYRCDVSNLEEMRQVIEKGEARFGHLNGVIHAAGILQGHSINFIESLDKADFEDQFKTKVYGLMTLNRVLQDKKIDSCLIISSLSSILGGIGFSAYAAGNIFMDYYVNSHIVNASHNKTRLMVVNIDGINFKEDSGAAHTVDDYSINKRELAEVLDNIMSLGDVSRVIVSKRDFQERINKWIDYKPGKQDAYPRYHESAAASARPKLTTGYIQPGSETEKKLAGLWQDFFGISQIGSDDDFFELGGDSLKMMTMLSKIHQTFDVEIAMPVFFAGANIARLGRYIDRSPKNKFVFIKKTEKKEYYPLSSAQKRLFILQQLGLKSTNYNISHIVPLSADIDIDKEKLEKKIKELLVRHESFRTSFLVIEKESVQRIYSNVDFSIEYYKISSESELEKIQEKFIRPFDLSKAPLLRIGYVEIDGSAPRLLFDLHHIISDAISQDIIKQEFLSLYLDEKLPALRLQYRDYAAWQNSRSRLDELKKQEEFWLQQFADGIPRLNFHIDNRGRYGITDSPGRRFRFIIDRDLTRRLKEILQAHDATLFMGLFAVYGILLSRYTRQEDIVVGTAAAGRTHIDLKNIIGMFANMLPLRCYPAKNKTFLEFLLEVKENSLAAFEHQDYQFDELVNLLRAKKRVADLELVETVFTMQNAVDPRLKENREKDIDLKDDITKSSSIKYFLTLDAFENIDTIEMMFSYSARALTDAAIEKMKIHFLGILRQALVDPDVKIKDIMLSSDMVVPAVKMRAEEMSGFNF